ncbi:MAG: Ig-like domain-containing protein [Myxococcota bacterium]
MSTHLLVLLGCGAPGRPELQLEGPVEVEVDRLGPVEGPRAVLDDGTEPEGVVWTVSQPGIARVDGDRIVAEAPGEVQVVAEWGGARVAWTLRVDVEAALAFVAPPPTVRVGEPVTLAITATSGGAPIDPGPVRWTTSNPAVLTVAAGGPLSCAVTGVAPGMVYLTARARSATAMVELEVVP